jgi:photosystem II stability/assembly factor-like uncharacterized protein
MTNAPILACLSPNGGTHTVAAGPAAEVAVATIEGIIFLARPDAGSEWTIVNRALTDLHISALLFEPRSGLLFAGAHGTGGLWVSDDRGATWQPRVNGLDRHNIYTLAAQQRGDRTILFAGTEPAALYRSDDLGASWYEHPALRSVPKNELWNFPPPPHIAHVKNVAFHPDEPQTLYVCIEQGALLKSTDDGASWFEIESYETPSADKFRNDTHRVLFAPSDPRWLYMVTGEGCYTSADAGATWDHVTHRDHTIGYPDAAFVDPRDENVMYLAGPKNAPLEWRTVHSADATVMRSLDHGRTWHEWRDGLPSRIIGNIEGMGMHSYGDAVTLFAGTATGEVYVSDDAGAHWSCAAAGLPPISKAQHYRHFLSEEARTAIENRMRAMVTAAG